jgi:site-specific DNA-methyltransferase (adenine-specific)/adenine-specific DNA-methyltransferase
MEESKLWDLNSDKRVWWGKSGNNSPRIKKFLSEAKQGMVPTTWWTHEFAGTNSGAKTELRSIIADMPSFMTPKPKELIERVLQIATNPGDLVMDSFAGSGTTGHAVLKMNAASPDATARRFIMVEVESEIARSITRERVSRVAKGYTNPKGEEVEGLGGSFRFCQLGEPLFDETGAIRSSVKFAELARHVYFSETGEPLPKERVPNTPFLGECRGVGIYLLFNGILGDKSASGGNMLTRSVLEKLPPFDGPKVIYCTGCLLGRERLASEQIIIRQTPYEIKTA